MSTRTALFFSVKVRVRGNGRRVWIPLPPVALYALHFALLSFDALIGLLPGRAGAYAAGAADSINALVVSVMKTGPHEYVRVSAEGGEGRAFVRVRAI